MTTLSVQNSATQTLSGAVPSPAPFAAGGGLLGGLWALSGALHAGSLSWLDTLNCAGILALMLGGMLAFRSAGAMSRSPAGRLCVTGVFLSGAVLLNPVFHRSLSALPFKELPLTAQAAAWAPLALGAALWLWARLCAMARVQDIDAGVAGQVETFLSCGIPRAHLALFGVLLLGAGLALSGLPMRAALVRSAVLAGVILAVRPLLQLAALPAGVHLLNMSMGAALGFAAIGGGMRYADLCGKVQAGQELLERNQPREARKIHDQAMALNKVLYAKKPEIQIETSWAIYLEQTGDLWGSIERWNQVADIQGLNRAEFLPLQRLACRTGNSIAPWRQLVFDGFAPVTHPEIAPGLKALAAAAPTDARARLLGALVSWALNDPPEECRRRLEDVQRTAPGEPSSHTLLRRMGATLPDGPLWLPGELLIGRKATSFSETGAIGELGELSTLLVLDSGRYELSLRAHGTPLHEEWPIIRVEMDEHLIGRTQVDRSVDYEVPFTLDINRGNIYRLKIVFENRMQDMESGRIALRGLSISGIILRRMKD